MDTLKYIIEALRTPSRPAGIYRDPGHPPLRIRGKGPAPSANYTKYLREQEAIGESPVSYEEFMRNM